MAKAKPQARVPGKRGPKRKIQQTEEGKIFAMLEAGCSLTDAADVLGIDRDTIRNRENADPKFSAGVKSAIAKGKDRLIKKVGKAKPWQAAAWMLERKWGAEYGKKVDVTSGGKSIVVRDETEDRNRDTPAEAALGAATGDSGGAEV